MKTKFTKILALILAACSLISCIGLSAFALEWDGDSTGGGGHGRPADTKGFAIRTTEDNVIGYRFSLVDKAGNLKGVSVIDVFRNIYYGRYGYSSLAKFDTKYNKLQMIENQNSGFSTSVSSVNCYKEADLDFASELPSADGMGHWQENGVNLNIILDKLGAGSLRELNTGDKLLVEPIYDVSLEGEYHAVTVAELAVYGKALLGGNSNGGSSSTAAQWGFIATYTNKHYPNALYTPDGQGLWPGATSLTKKATFQTIIDKGYGVGIAYTQEAPPPPTTPDPDGPQPVLPDPEPTIPDPTPTEPTPTEPTPTEPTPTEPEPEPEPSEPTLTVKKCQVWPGALGNREKLYGISTGSGFYNWIYESGYPRTGDTVWYSVNFPAEEENAYVRQRVWIGQKEVSRDVWSNDNTWFDVAIDPTTVPSTAPMILVRAREDWIDENGNILKYGTQKTFYIPLRPLIYRQQVSMIDLVGKECAYSNLTEKSGMVYVGQRAYARYLYTTGDLWGSGNNLYANMLQWKDNGWKPVKSSGWDGLKTNAWLNSTTSQTLTSNLGFIRVPDNSGSGKNQIKFQLSSGWSVDELHTLETTWHSIDVVKADAQLVEILLIDSNGYYVEPDELYPGQQITVQYKYYNNTPCRIFIEGYINDGSKLNGIYAINPYSYCYVNGYTFTVPDQRNLRIWGGVYLESAGKGNTSWESDGNNNELYLDCEIDHALILRPISPNAQYRENTEVITSYWLVNRHTTDYTPSRNISIRFRVYNSSGQLMTTVTKNQVIVPSKEQNLIYFKWKVPEGVTGSVTIRAEIIDRGVVYNPVLRRYATRPYTMSQTPDTQYEEAAPDGFTIPATPGKTSTAARWYEFTFENGRFVKKQYGFAIARTTDTVIPATGNTHYRDGDAWVMKSGYAVRLRSRLNLMATISGYARPSSNAFTLPQYSRALFPEYRYSTATGQYVTLEQIGGFAELPFFGSYGRVHFTPLWFPDGAYNIRIVHSDCWTPAGMLTFSSVTRPLIISGSAYDDYYVGH